MGVSHVLKYGQILDGKPRVNTILLQFMFESSIQIHKRKFIIPRVEDI
jgi:hypothetical protein